MGLFDGHFLINAIIDFPESTVALLPSQEKNSFSATATFSAMFETPPNDTRSNSWHV
jgi:hypothetical protein